MRAIFLVSTQFLVPTRRVGMQWQRAALRDARASTEAFSRQRDCESIHHSAKKRRHSSMNAGIQLQGEHSEGFETVCRIILFIIMQLPSLALDSGIHARMTGLKIVASNNEHLLEMINTFTVSKAWER